MRTLLLVFLAVAVTGCSIIYRLPTRQGNVIEQKQLDQLRVGMTRQQVEYLLGTPLAASPFDNQRWDYVGYYRSPRGQVSERTVSLFFKDNKLVKMQGVSATAEDKALEQPDARTLAAEEKKDRTERSREESVAGKSSGISVTPPQPRD